MNEVSTLLMAQWKLHKASPKVIGYAVVRAAKAGAIEFPPLCSPTPTEAAQRRERMLRDFTALPLGEQTKYIAAAKERDLGSWLTQITWAAKFVWWYVRGRK